MQNNIEHIITVIDHIENNLNKKLDLTSIANAVRYSKYYLHRMFHDTIGLSIHDYVKRRQLTEAAKLLVFSNKSILEIAFIAGYDSQQAFSTVFKQMYKKTPNEYRLNQEFYPLQLRFILNEDFSTPSLPDDIKTNITLATISDIPLWLNLVHLIIDGYPNLKENEYLEYLKKSIYENRAFILKDKNIAIAVMAINYDSKCIDFFGVHPLYRKCKIPRLFLDKVMNEFLKGEEISITTFREGDKADTGYRKIYKELGFAEDELLIEFGYPTQRLVLTPSTGGNENESIRK